jgi:hypothetical protein
MPYHHPHKDIKGAWQIGKDCDLGHLRWCFPSIKFLPAYGYAPPIAPEGGIRSIKSGEALEFRPRH